MGFLCWDSSWRLTFWLFTQAYDNRVMQDVFPSFCSPQVFRKGRNHGFRREEWARRGYSRQDVRHGNHPSVYVLQSGAQRRCLTSSLIPLQRRHTNQRERISSVFFCLFVYLLCTVVTVRADIQWWICVILFQLLICIESVPPGDINQHVCSSLKDRWLLVIVTKLQWWDVSHYATGAVFQSK